MRLVVLLGVCHCSIPALSSVCLSSVLCFALNVQKWFLLNGRVFPLCVSALANALLHIHPGSCPVWPPPSAAAQWTAGGWPETHNSSPCFCLPPRGKSSENPYQVNFEMMSHWKIIPSFFYCVLVCLSWCCSGRVLNSLLPGRIFWLAKPFNGWWS